MNTSRRCSESSTGTSERCLGSRADRVGQCDDPIERGDHQVLKRIITMKTSRGSSESSESSTSAIFK